MRYLSLSILERAMLVKLFEFSQEHSKMLSSGTVAKMFGGTISAKRIELAAEALNDTDLISTSHYSSGCHYEITRKGYLEVEKLLQEPYSFETTYKVHGDKWLLDVDHSEFEEEIPASDRVVTLDHNQPEYEDAVKSVDALQELVRGNNEFAAANPGEHSQILSELSAIRELLEAQQISPSRFKAFAWGTFAYLMEKFADGPISAAADLAWKALSQLLGFG